MTKKRTYKVIEKDGRKYNILALPGTNFFKFEIINKWGSNIERLYEKKYNKNVYGISHFIEHLSFRSPKDYTTIELNKLLKLYGVHNASTDYDRINYFFETTMDRIDLGIKLVANISLNTLDKIPEDEFQIEKKVVYNEAKRYLDSPQTMFWFNSTGALTGYKSEDNVIGIPETIDTFTQDDCVAIKSQMLQGAETVYNITFDSELLTENEVIEKIENELIRHQPITQFEPITHDEYMSVVEQPKNITTVLENESEQAMTIVNLDVVTNKITADAGNVYLSNYAEETSLNDIIREQNGLTYGISFGASNTSYKTYTYFGCDVTRGTETLLMELFDTSINKSVDNWGETPFNNFMIARKLKRTMSLLDQKNYGSWHNTATWYPEIIEELQEVLAEDLDKAYDIMDERYVTENKIKDYIETVRRVVNSKEYGKVTN